MRMCEVCERELPEKSFLRKGNWVSKKCFRCRRICATPGKYSETLEQRLTRWMTVNPATGCWEWIGHCHPRTGYGQIVFDGRQQGAHRAAWLQWRGEITAGLYVCHKCDNPRCINPEHLFLGTQADNIHDCIAKGRYKFRYPPRKEASQ